MRQRLMTLVMMGWLLVLGGVSYAQRGGGTITAHRPPPSDLKIIKGGVSDPNAVLNDNFLWLDSQAVTLPPGTNLAIRLVSATEIKPWSPFVAMSGSADVTTITPTIFTVTGTRTNVPLETSGASHRTDVGGCIFLANENGTWTLNVGGNIAYAITPSPGACLVCYHALTALWYPICSGTPIDRQPQ